MPKTVVETHRLYEGHPKLPKGKSFIEILYYPNSHAYKESGETLIGVSGVKDIIEKEGLRYFYMNEAIDYLTRTLIPNNDGVFKMPTGDEWAEACKQAKKAYKVKQTRGADTGTETHEWIEKFLIAKRDGTKPPELPESYEIPKKEKGMSWEKLEEIEIKKERNNLVEALSQFVHYCEKHEVEVVELERLVFSMKYRYAGRFDAALRIDGKLYLVDFKTNNPTSDFPDGIYPDMLLQIGGYDLAYTEELYPDLDDANESAFDGHAVFNFSKKNGKFTKKFVEGEEVKVNRSWFAHTVGTKRAMQYHVRKMSMRYKENREAKNVSKVA